LQNQIRILETKQYRKQIQTQIMKLKIQKNQR
ncbi:LPXTG-protein cell wall anchor protein, partial [Enterococcus faecium]